MPALGMRKRASAQCMYPSTATTRLPSLSLARPQPKSHTMDQSSSASDRVPDVSPKLSRGTPYCSLSKNDTVAFRKTSSMTVANECSTKKQKFLTVMLLRSAMVSRNT